MADLSAFHDSNRQVNTHLEWTGALGALMDITQETVCINPRISSSHRYGLCQWKTMYMDQTMYKIYSAAKNEHEYFHVSSYLLIAVI